MKNVKKNQVKTLAIISAILAFAGLFTAVLAAYNSTITGSNNIATITGWSVAFDDVSTSGTTQTAANIQLNNGNAISPGDSGTFTITLKNNSDVDADYSVDLYNFQLGGVAADLSKYNFAFNLGSSEGPEITTIGVQGTTPDISGEGISKGNGEAEITVYWSWTSGEHDNELAGKSLTIDVSATLKQATTTA